MKQQLRRLFWPILRVFESGNEAYAYKAQNRKVLIAVGALFLLLAAALVVMVPGKDIGFYIPLIVFFLVGLVCEVVALLGSDRAVAKIWGSRQR